MSIKKMPEDLDNEKNMETYFEKQLERTNYWLSFAEVKNAGLIVIDISVISFLQDFYSDNNIFKYSLLLLTILSALFCLLSFAPELTEKINFLNKIVKFLCELFFRKKSDYAFNPIYFGSIASLNNVDDYINKVKTFYFKDDCQISNESKYFAEEVYINSKITARKYNMFTIALNLLLLALLLSLILVIWPFVCKILEKLWQYFINK